MREGRTCTPLAHGAIGDGIAAGDLAESLHRHWHGARAGSRAGDLAATRIHPAGGATLLHTARERPPAPGHARSVGSASCSALAASAGVPRPPRDGAITRNHGPGRFAHHVSTLSTWASESLGDTRRGMVRHSIVSKGVSSWVGNGLMRCHARYASCRTWTWSPLRANPAATFSAAAAGADARHWHAVCDARVPLSVGLHGLPWAGGRSAE